MSEFNYFKEKRRMVESIGGHLDDMYCDGPCKNCPLMGCIILEMKHPEEAEAIVRKWAEEHPQKTRKDLLIEKFPNAKCNKDGVPDTCAYYLGMVSEEYYAKCGCENCAKCWNTEVEE